MMGVAGRASIFLLKFTFTLVIMTIACAIAWEAFVDNRLYSCTDPGFFDYLDPGDWVHEHGGLPIKVVPQVVPTDDMSLPDTIKEGWTVQRLWYLWYAFLGVSLLVSALLARLPWVPRRWREL
jgi:hypothetical protein